MLSSAMICLVLLAPAQTDTTGLTVREALYPDSTLRERFFLDSRGLRTGQYRSYYPDGVVATQGAFAEGMRTGAWIEFDSTGVPIAQTNYDSVGAVLRAPSPPPETGPKPLRAPKQGVVVSTNNDSVQILVNGAVRHTGTVASSSCRLAGTV